MKKTMLLLTLALVVVLAIGSVFAYQYGNYNKTGQSVNKDEARAAIVSGNYTTWRALHNGNNGKMTSLINETNFPLLKQMYEAKDAGNMTKVKEIKASIGFIPGNNKGNCMQKGQGNGMAKGHGNCMNKGKGNSGKCPYTDLD